MAEKPRFPVVPYKNAVKAAQDTGLAVLETVFEPNGRLIIRHEKPDNRIEDREVEVFFEGQDARSS